MALKLYNVSFGLAKLREVILVFKSIYNKKLSKLHSVPFNVLMKIESCLYLFSYIIFYKKYLSLNLILFIFFNLFNFISLISLKVYNLLVVYENSLGFFANI